MWRSKNLHPWWTTVSFSYGYLARTLIPKETNAKISGKGFPLVPNENNVRNIRKKDRTQNSEKGTH